MKKKILSVLASAMMTMSVAAVIPTENMTANAVSQNVLLGDANADGSTDIADAVCIQRYLVGREHPTAYKLTAMDANQDKVIDFNDIYNVYQVEAGTIPSTTVQKELYAIPYHFTDYKLYRRHNCSDYSSYEYAQYSLPCVYTPTFSTAGDDELEFLLRGLPSNDTVNTGTVKITIGDTVCSGFVIADHVIATSASNIYDKSTGKFKSGVTVNIYNASGNTLVGSYAAAYLHIPADYANNIDAAKNNYGLIYVNDDLSAYKVEVGVAVDEFMATSSSVTISGYNSSGVRKRSTGSVSSSFSNNIMKVNTQINDSMIGGQAYCELNTYKSAIGVAEAYDSTNEITDTVRFTPDILKFYKYNDELVIG